MGSTHSDNDTGDEPQFKFQFSDGVLIVLLVIVLVLAWSL
jgi:hypothetical protein